MAPCRFANQHNTVGAQVRSLNLGLKVSSHPSLPNVPGTQQTT
jgi:hypothetical protein